MKILVIDDEQTWCNTIELLMNDIYSDLEIKCITKPLTAKRIIKKYKPDIILVDYDMRGMNGDQVIEQNKEIIDRENIKIILMSSYSIKPLLQKHECGFIDKLETYGAIESVIDQAYYIKRIEDFNLNRVKQLKEEIKTLKKINK
jgi:two-component SAPR family response regulator